MSLLQKIERALIEYVYADETRRDRIVGYITSYVILFGIASVMLALTAAASVALALFMRWVEFS